VKLKASEYSESSSTPMTKIFLNPNDTIKEATAEAKAQRILSVPEEIQGMFGL
jgi:hypothetical protein